MKTLTAFRRKVLMLLMIFSIGGFALKQSSLMAQVPDCAGTFMYGLWNDSLGSGSSTPSEIRPINYLTGAVGARVGGTTYVISKTVSGTTYYGSAGLALDPVNKHFFVMTQMPTNKTIDKDIFDINPVGGAMTRIGTTPSSVGDHHFVKLAVSPGGIGYAIGVHRDTTIGSFTTAHCNPLISFTTCGGAPTVGCSTITLLGYLSSSSANTVDWQLFNGDIAFDNAGNLFFLTVSLKRVNGNSRYCDARLFKIAAANVPTVAGTGQIPMSLIADYNGLDSTVINGIAFDMLGTMYFSTRTFNGPQNSSPAPTYNNVVLKSTAPGSTTAIGFTNPLAGFSLADLASCNFPTGVLSDVRLDLNAWNESGTAKLKWNVNMNNQVAYYELQSSENGSDFKTIARINPTNINTATASYSFDDPNSNNASVKYYRIREAMANNNGYYSNVVKVNFSSKLMLISKPSPNPFQSQFDLNLELKSSNPVSIKIMNQSGAMVRQRMVNGAQGANKITVDGLTGLSAGVYVVEIRVDEEVIREKLIKQ